MSNSVVLWSDNVHGNISTLLNLLKLSLLASMWSSFKKVLRGAEKNVCLVLLGGIIYRYLLSPLVWKFGSTMIFLCWFLIWSFYMWQWTTVFLHKKVCICLYDLLCLVTSVLWFGAYMFILLLSITLFPYPICSDHFCLLQILAWSPLWECSR